MPLGKINGIPLGMTLHARKGDEKLLLQMMAAWERLIRPRISDLDAGKLTGNDCFDW